MQTTPLKGSFHKPADDSTWNPLALYETRHHEAFLERGYLVLGQLLSRVELVALRRRIDDLMLGRIRRAGMQFQLDTGTGQYARLEPRTDGPTRETLAYRRIDGLEHDPLFLEYLQHPVFRQITRRYIGPEVSIFRAMLMNKPAAVAGGGPGGTAGPGGTELPWHQDVGEGWGLDANPTITVWTALDDATTESGCMQIVPGSHALGILNAGHYATEEDVRRHIDPDAVVDLEVRAGEAVLLHNWLLHRSGLNRGDGPRRAFSVAYMDAGTRARASGQTFPVVFGAGALRPTHDG